MSPSMRRFLSLAASFMAGAVTASASGMYLVAAHPRFVSRVEAHLLRSFDFSSTATVQSPTPDTPIGAVIVRIDNLAAPTPISPLIYGVAFADPAYLKNLGASANRWGGNATSTFNWDNGNADNAGRDWQFRNQGGTGNAADEFIASTLSANAQPVITIPTIGWVAKNADNNTMSIGVPSQGGPPLAAGSEAISGYDPTANRQRTSVPSLPSDHGTFAPAPDPRAAVVYQDAWVHYLAGKFGTGAHGVNYFEMDNEPDLWWLNHTDVRPAELGYADMLNEFTTYADAVKAADPSAQILGPVVSGWTAYQFSALDRGSDNYRTHADRQAHGDVPFLEWWLRQVAEHDRTVGKRTLDYLDVHYYPQGQNVFNPRGSDPATQALRIRSVRSLYDPTYTDESWIGEPVDLIPMLKAWIAKGYPGTKLAITEYNFGGDFDASGAVAEAEALGVFGRNGVAMADYWTNPPKNSPVEAAFRLYRNYDGKGGKFGDLSLPIDSGSRQIAAFASMHSDTGEVDVVLANESLTHSGAVNLQLLGSGSYTAEQYVISPGSSVITAEAMASAASTITVDPLSVRLVKLTRR